LRRQSESFRLFMARHPMRDDSSLFAVALLT
jgi:hypothetical protein